MSKFLGGKVDLLNILFRKPLSFWQKVVRFARRTIKEWKEKQEWRRYDCGIYTDLDVEKRCPVCGLEEKSKEVIVRKLVLRWLIWRGRVWTKHQTKIYPQ